MRVVFANQAFFPDVVASAQYATDLARGLSARGHDVTVFTSRRAYGRPGTRVSSRERIDGIEVVRIPGSSLGKATPLRRTIDGLSFMAGVALMGLATRSPDVFIVMTSPPMLPTVIVGLARLKRTRSVLWLLDMNPDEAFAAGTIRRTGPLGRALSAVDEATLSATDHVVVLDRFMEQRIRRKGVNHVGVTVIPPWSQDEDIVFDAEGRRRFRQAHDLDQKYVVMYAGNHSPCHPLDTLVAAATELRGDPDYCFCFVGGGSEMDRVRRAAAVRELRNVRCLPYAGRSELPGWLSAADAHVVVMGDAFVGIVHPCKIYNIISLGIPFLFIGPDESHVKDLANDAGFPSDCGFAHHTDVETVIEWIRRRPRRRESAEGPPTRSRYSQTLLVGHLSQVVEGLATRQRGGPVSRTAD